MKRTIDNVEFERLDSEKLLNLISTQFHSEMKEKFAIVNLQLETVRKCGKGEIGFVLTAIQSIRNFFFEYIDLEDHLLFPLLSSDDRKNDEVKEETDRTEFIDKLKERQQRIKNQLEQIRHITNGYQCKIDSSPSHKLALAQLNELEQDFKCLFLVEEKYLFPRLLYSYCK